MASTKLVGLGEDFIDVESERPWPEWPHHKTKDFYSQWLDKVSAPSNFPTVFGADALKRLYPNHSIVITEDRLLDILVFPGVRATPEEKSPLITNLFFVPIARRLGIPGVLVDGVQFGIFKISWQRHEFIAHILTYPTAYSTKTIRFILHEGSEDVTRLFLKAVGTWAHELHNEIWDFDGNFWTKNHSLWTQVQQANWGDIILKDSFKDELQKDVYGFFDSEDVYQQHAIPWKRGLILHGPPGNGKTITVKAIMKTCISRGFIPLYVRSFKGWAGEEASIREAFKKARELAPCLIILEDLDSLINDRSRSFFLNQLDGLEGNDGILVIGTTNHFEKLDSGISKRPSRFDRKYLFDDPGQTERKLYAQYWRQKLCHNKDIQFPGSLVDEFVTLTAGFSFAYLKEAFVSSLVLLAGNDDKELSFANILRGQVAQLRGQLNASSFVAHSIPTPQRRSNDYGSGGALRLSHWLTGPPEPVRPSDRLFSTTTHTASDEHQTQDNRLREGKFRELIDRLSSRLDDVNEIDPEKRFYVTSQPSDGNER